MIEFETSFKQLFMFKLLFQKISDACKPVTQIFEHIDSQAINTRSAPTDLKGRQRREYDSEKSSPKSGVLLSLHVSSIYVALIKESQFGEAFAGGGSSFMANENSCVPMLSLEIKWFELRQKA